MATANNTEKEQIQPAIFDFTEQVQKAEDYRKQPLTVSKLPFAVRTNHNDAPISSSRRGKVCRGMSLGGYFWHPRGKTVHELSVAGHGFSAKEGNI